MNPIEIVKSVIGIVILLAVAYLAWDYVRCKQELAVLHTVIESADAQAKANEVHYKENHDAIESDIVIRESAIRNYYRGLLYTRDKIAASKDANSAQVPDEPASELGTCRQSIEFIEGCALDANHVLMFQEWVRVNQLPVE